MAHEMSRRCTYSSAGQSCAEWPSWPTIHDQVDQLWAFEDILGERRDLEWVSSALRGPAVAEVPWWGSRARHSTGQRHPMQEPCPVCGVRSTPQCGITGSANRPGWTSRAGVRTETLPRLSQGHAEQSASPRRPTTRFAQRLRAELAVSGSAVRQKTKRYEDAVAPGTSRRSPTTCGGRRRLPDVLAAVEAL